MHRPRRLKRALLLGALAGLVLVAFPLRAQDLEEELAPAEPTAEEAPPEIEAVPMEALPLFDAHNHAVPGLTPELLSRFMDELGVSRIVLMGTGASQRDLDTLTQLTLALQESQPDRVISFLPLNPVRNITRSLLDYLDRHLATGKFRGLGELLGLHYGFHERRGEVLVQAPDVMIPLESTGVADLMCLAARHNVVLTLHMETTAGTVTALDGLLARNPRAKIIWAHQTHSKTLDGAAAENARQADPDQLADLLERYPNLYADMAPGFEILHLGAAAMRAIPEPWRELYERYSDRFLVGHDMPFLVNWEDPEIYRSRGGLVRAWLSQLSPEAQQRIAHENMERILTAAPAPPRTCQFLSLR